MQIGNRPLGKTTGPSGVPSAAVDTGAKALALAEQTLEKLKAAGTPVDAPLFKLAQASVEASSKVLEMLVERAGGGSAQAERLAQLGGLAAGTGSNLPESKKRAAQVMAAATSPEMAWYQPGMKQFSEEQVVQLEKLGDQLVRPRSNASEEMQGYRWIAGRAAMDLARGPVTTDLKEEMGRIISVFGGNAMHQAAFLNAAAKDAG